MPWPHPKGAPRRWCGDGQRSDASWCGHLVALSMPSELLRAALTVRTTVARETPNVAAIPASVWFLARWTSTGAWRCCSDSECRLPPLRPRARADW